MIDFLSHAAIVGFMGGAAITIALQQLKGFLGIKKFTKKTDLISVLHSVLDSAHHGVSYKCFFSLKSFFTSYMGNAFCNMKNVSLNKFPNLLISYVSNIFAVELADHSHWSSVFKFSASC